MKTNWQQDSWYVLLGLTLTLVFLGAVVTIAGLLILLLSAVAPSSLRQILQSVNQPLQIGLLLMSLLELIAWNLLPMVGFAPERLARRMAVVMGAIMLFTAMSLLFSL